MFLTELLILSTRILTIFLSWIHLTFEDRFFSLQSFIMCVYAFLMIRQNIIIIKMQNSTVHHRQRNVSFQDKRLKNLLESRLSFCSPHGNLLEMRKSLGSGLDWFSGTIFGGAVPANFCAVFLFFLQVLS